MWDDGFIIEISAQKINDSVRICNNENEISMKVKRVNESEMSIEINFSMKPSI